MRHYTVKPEGNEKRLDQFLTLMKPDLSRSFIQKLIKEGHIFVNNKKTTKAGAPLKEGDEVIMNMPSMKEVGLQAEKIPLDILYEDKDMIVVNKPAGMVVHPTDHGAHLSGTLVNAVLYHCKKTLSGIGGELRPGIVHRLDKDTSGAIMVAKNDIAHRFLSKQIEAHQVKKHYVALLKGHLSPQEGSIEAPLMKNIGAKEVRISSRKDAKYALTHYKVREYKGDFSLVDIQIVTGRTHQIRVHFAAIHHPVCGDSMYGDPDTNRKLENLGLKRQFLHAAELTFKVPGTKKEMTLKAPLSPDLESVLKKLI